MTGRGPALLRLALALARGRARVALSRRFGGGALVSGAVYQLLTVAVLLFAAIFYAWVAAVLVGTLAGRGLVDEASAAAAVHAELVLVLVLMTSLLSDAEGTGLDLRPLAALGLTRQDRLVSGLVEELLLRPSALIIWPSCAALIVGLSQAGAKAAALALPASAGLAVVAVALSLLVRRVAGAASSPGRGAGLGAIALRMALVLLPLAWALGALTGAGAGLSAMSTPFRPGHWFAGAASSALHGERDALVWGLAPLLVGLGLLITAARAGAAHASGWSQEVPAGRRFAAASLLPLECLRVWRLPRVRLVAAQSLTAGLAMVILAGAVASRGVVGMPVASLGSLLVAWIVVSGPAAVAANALGAGGAPGVLALATARSPLRWLARSEAWINAPPAVAAAAAGLAAATILGAPRAGWLGASLAFGIACASAGVGAVTSVVWPWRTELAAEGDAVWPPGPGRWIVPLAHALPLGTSAAHLVRDPGCTTAEACGMIAASGALVGLAGFALAARVLRRDRALVAEKLLT